MESSRDFGGTFPILRTCWTATNERSLQFLRNGVLGFSPVEVCLFSPTFLCNLVWKSPQCLEKFGRFPDGEKCPKSCHVSGCHGFSDPDLRALKCDWNQSTVAKVRKRTNRRFSQFPDFCRVSSSPRKQSKWEAQLSAENCRKSQETAENCRPMFVPLDLSP